MNNDTTHIKISISAGTPISEAAKDLYLLARQKNRRIEADFNGITIWSDPDSTIEEIQLRYDLESECRRKNYEKSPEGIAAKSKFEQDKISHINDAKSYIDLLRSSDLSDLTNVITLLRQSTKLGWVYTTNEALEMTNILKDNGYEENVFCGDEFVEGNKEIEARWLIGQAMNMPGHGFVTKFAEDWLNKYAI